MAGKNRRADEFDGQVRTTKQPLRRQWQLSAAKLPAAAGFSLIEDDPLLSFASQDSTTGTGRW